MRTKSSSRDITSSVTCGGGVRLTGTAGRSLQPRKRSTLGDHRSRRDHKSRSRHDHHKPTLTGTANLAGARCGLSSATGCALLAYRTGRASRSAWAAQSHAPGLWYFPGRVRFSGCRLGMLWPIALCSQRICMDCSFRSTLRTK